MRGYHRWSDTDDNLLKEQITKFGYAKGCKTTAALLGVTYEACTNRLRKLRKAGFTDYMDTRVGMNPETIAIIRQCVQENPNNLQEAFRTASVRTGLKAETISQGWYDKKSRKHRDKIGKCFCLVGTTGAGINRKNFVPDSMSSHRNVFSWLKNLLGF